MNQPGYSGNSLFLLAALEWLSGRPSASVTPAETRPVLQSGIDPLHGWTMLGVTVGGILPVGILLFGLLVYIPVSRKF